MSENMIVRQAGTTVWKQIQESLGNEILGGRLQGRLPNETELAERYAVNRHTVRQAVKALVEQGLVELSSRAKTLAVNSLDVVDGKVIGVCTQYFPLPRFEGFGEAYSKVGKTHLALAQFGVEQFQRKLSRITARLPTNEVAQQLGQPTSLP